jgi:pimeloyl-ACP methyl ester carboxylesterase
VAEPVKSQPARAPTEADIRGENLARQVRRHTWINIAGPIAAVFLGIFAAAMYLRPVDVLRWIQISRLGWSGVTQNDLALKEGMITYLMTGGYSEMEPVVMIHGLGPNAALVWRGIMPPVADAHYKVVAPNLPGFASSEHKQVQYSIAYQAEAVAQMIDELKLDHVNLVGNDLGADVALYYAVEHPDKVERMVLVSGGLVGARGAEKLRKGMLPTAPDAIREQVEASFFDLPPMPEVIYQRMMEQLAGDMQAETDMINSVPRDEAHIRSKLSAVFNTLTIIMWGAKNPYFSAAEGEELHAAMPGSATVVFKTSGPYPQLEHPDDFAESLIFVIKQEEGGR